MSAEVFLLTLAMWCGTDQSCRRAGIKCRIARVGAGFVGHEVCITEPKAALKDAEEFMESRRKEWAKDAAKKGGK